MGITRNGLVIIAIVLIILGVLTVLVDRHAPTPTYAAADLAYAARLPTPTRTPFQPLPTATPDIKRVMARLAAEEAGEASAERLIAPTTMPTDPPDRPEDIRLPYDDYVLTQGTHGKAYGHAAIDLAAGRGAPILSPISGQVTFNGFDFYGNPQLTIENEVWQVILLHGDFYPQEDEWVGIGQQIGAESNKGNTVDIYGQSCRRRRCGYHTHMNVFDKRIEQNANLIKLLNP